MSRAVSLDVPYSASYPSSDFWSGYDPDMEDREALEREAIEYAYASIPRAQDTPAEFTIGEWWDTESQGKVGRCAGMAGASAGEVEYFKLTGKEIQFNGHYTYILGQNRTQWRGGDNGTSIHSVVTSVKEDGLCPIDFNGDGKPDYPMPPRYTTQIPEAARRAAAAFKMGYHAFLKSWDDILGFLQTQGTVFVGGDWGNWGPNQSGLVDGFSSGGGGHAWMISGWDLTRRKYSSDVLEGVNSQGKNWGKRGFHYMTRRFIDQFLRSRNTVIVGVSKLTVPGPTIYTPEMWRKRIKLKLAKLGKAS